MSSSSANFDGLKKMLKWKRHEQPPPRFFNEFSGRVLARIEAGETGKKTSWWELLGFEFGLKPALAGATAMLAGGMLVYGIISSMNEPARATLPGQEGQGIFPSPGLASTQPAGSATLAAQPSGSDNSTNPVLSVENPSPFGGSLKLQVKPVNFTPEN